MFKIFSSAMLSNDKVPLCEEEKGGELDSKYIYICIYMDINSNILFEQVLRRQRRSK